MWRGDTVRVATELLMVYLRSSVERLIDRGRSIRLRGDTVRSRYRVVNCLSTEFRYCVRSCYRVVNCLSTEFRSGNSGLCMMARGAAIMGSLRNLWSGTWT